MNRTKIEWVKNPDGSQGYTWNPITGCLNGCPYCYARKLAKGRLRQRYLANNNIAPVKHYSETPAENYWQEDAAIRAWGERIQRAHNDPFYPRFWPRRLEEPLRYAKPCGIFAVDMGELFGDWIPYYWQQEIFHATKLCPQHRFYLLTKQPQNLIKFSPFPPNCYVGVSVTRNNQLDNALKYLKQIQATVKFISFEPLLERIKLV